MRIGILENIMTPGGHEVDFDRILVEELQAMGHEVSFYVPRGFRFAMDYQVPVHELGAEVVSYTGVTGIRKLVRTVRRELHRLHWYRELYEAARRGEIDAIVVPTSTYRYLRALRRSILRKSPVPVVFILHGINPGEAPKFLRAVDALSACPKTRPAVLCFADSIFGERRRNIRLLYPPTYVPRDIAWRPGEPSLPVVWGRDNAREEGRTLPQGGVLSSSVFSGNIAAKNVWRIFWKPIWADVIRVPWNFLCRARPCIRKMQRRLNASSPSMKSRTASASCTRD